MPRRERRDKGKRRKGGNRTRSGGVREGGRSMREREKGGERGKGWKERRARGMSSLARNALFSFSLFPSLSLSLPLVRARAGEGEARPKDEKLCKKRDETGRIPRDKRRRGRRRRRDGGTKEDHAGDYNINKQMSLEAGEFAIQSGTGGGREAESPPTNLEGLPRTLAPSLDLSSPSPARASPPPNFSLSLSISIFRRLSPPLCPLPSPSAFFSPFSHSLFLSPASRCDSRFYVYKTRCARFDGKTTARRSALSFVFHEDLVLLRVIMRNRSRCCIGGYHFAHRVRASADFLSVCCVAVDEAVVSSRRVNNCSCSIFQDSNAIREHTVSRAHGREIRNGNGTREHG